MQESKFMYGIGIWIIGNNVQASFITSGAFEISIDEVVIFSKLETGHMPTSQNLIQIFTAYGLDVNWVLGCTQSWQTSDVAVLNSMHGDWLTTFATCAA